MITSLLIQLYLPTLQPFFPTLAEAKKKKKEKRSLDSLSYCCLLLKIDSPLSSDGCFIGTNDNKWWSCASRAMCADEIGCVYDDDNDSNEEKEKVGH